MDMTHCIYYNVKFNVFLNHSWNNTSLEIVMADESPFNKLHVEPSLKGDLASLLEQLNLPPKAVKFIQKNLKAIYALCILIVVLAVSWSAYDAYHQKKINQSSSALATAMQDPLATRSAALHKVIADFPGTSAALWAQVELAHIDMNAGSFKDAAEKYTAVRGKVGTPDPLYALVTFGVAQAEEAGKEYDQALLEYQSLAKIEGYQALGLLGMGRIHEMKGEKDKALSDYELYMSTMVGDNRNDPEKALVSEKIGRLKAKP
jgi:predicted negative regulator of RcsB-dependent stress response